MYSGLSGKSGDDDFNQDKNPHNRGLIPFTNIANNVYLDKEHLGTVVINSREKQNKVQKGNLFFLMSSEGYEDIGKTAVLADEIEEAYLNSFCKDSRISQYIYRMIVNHIGGGTVENISNNNPDQQTPYKVWKF